MLTITLTHGEIIETKGKEVILYKTWARIGDWVILKSDIRQILYSEVDKNE